MPLDVPPLVEGGLDQADPLRDVFTGKHSGAKVGARLHTGREVRVRSVVHTRGQHVLDREPDRLAKWPSHLDLRGREAAGKVGAHIVRLWLRRRVYVATDVQVPVVRWAAHFLPRDAARVVRDVLEPIERRDDLLDVLRTQDSSAPGRRRSPASALMKRTVPRRAGGFAPWRRMTRMHAGMPVP